MGNICNNGPDIQDAQISEVCENCGKAIFEGEECYKIGDKYYCDDCVKYTEAKHKNFD